MVQAVAMDIQPITNLRILKYVGDEKKGEWAKHFMAEGFKGKPLMQFKNRKKNLMPRKGREKE